MQIRTMTVFAIMQRSRKSARRTETAEKMARVKETETAENAVEGKKSSE